VTVTDTLQLQNIHSSMTWSGTGNSWTPPNDDDTVDPTATFSNIPCSVPRLTPSVEQVEQWILQSYQPHHRNIQQPTATQCLQQWTNSLRRTVTVCTPVVNSTTTTTTTTCNDATTKPQDTTTNSTTALPAQPVGVVLHTLLQLLQHTPHVTVQFYVLSTLQQQRHSLSSTQQIQLRTYLIYQFYTSSSNRSFSNSGGNGNGNGSIPTYLRNKVAALIATFLIQDTTTSVDSETCTNTDRNHNAGWTTVHNDMMHIASEYPELFVQTFICLMEDFVMTSETASCSIDTVSSYNNNNNNNNHHHETVYHQGHLIHGNGTKNTVTMDQTRRLKDLLKGYQNDHVVTESITTTTTTTAAAAIHPTSSSGNTLLQSFYSALIRIYETSFQSIPGTVVVSNLPLQLLCIRAMTGIFQWTTMEFLGEPNVVRCLEFMLYTIRNWNTANNNNHPTHHGIFLEVYKATLLAWKEWVTSCNTNTTTSCIATTTTTTTTMNETSNSISPPISIQSIADPKLPVLCRLLECIHETNMIPPLTAAQIANDTHHEPNDIITNNSNNNYDSHENNYDDDHSIDSETMEVIIQMAILVNTIGLELLPLYELYVLLPSIPFDQKNSAVETLFHQVLDLFFRVFAYDDIDVSNAVLPFAVRFSYYMAEDTIRDDITLTKTTTTTVHVASSMRQHLPLMLNILYHQLKYPIDFSYNYEDENDAEEVMYRTELCNVYKKLIRAAPMICLQFVGEALFAQLSSGNVAAVPTPNMEASLRLLYCYCEAIRPPPGLKVVMQNESFCTILRALHSSNIANHPHREVLCLYYETAVRYYPIFLVKENVELLSRLLSALSGPTGLQHDHPRVRSRCCYLLLRLVKSTITLLRPYVETAVNGIQSLLSQPNLLLRSDDTLFLFETIGLLLGKTGLESSSQQRYITVVITPHVRAMDHILTNVPTLQADAEHYGEILSISIAAITNLSKGFTNPVDEVALVLTETLNIALTVLQTLPNSEPIRNKSMVLLQRMIVCVGKNVLVAVSSFLHVLIPHCTSDDILFVSQIINQLCIKFKEDATPVIDSVILPFLQKCQALTPANHEVVDTAEHLPPHLETEQLAIRKLSYVVMHHIVTHKVTAVLFSTTNASHLESILQMMNDGAIYVNDFIVKKTCLRFFRMLVEQLDGIKLTSNGTATTNVNYRNGIMTFTCQSVVPNVFQSMVSNPALVRDANGGRVISEFAQLIYTVQKICKNNLNELQEYQNCIGCTMQRYAPAIDVVTLLQRQTTTVDDVASCLRQIFQSALSKKK
jgi:hypothetical protein